MHIIEEIYDIYKRHSAICTDTRTIEKHCIFFALKGGNFDGNKFASEALRKGASFAIIDDRSYMEEERTILVDDVLTCLQDLASYHRNLFKSIVIGITGSNGKTTTKELLNVILGTQYNVHATSGNLNNHIGVPLTLLKQGAEHNLMIVEMGANSIGEISILCGICDPDIGLITNIGKAHLKGFGSFEGVKKAKLELYSFINHKNGLVFVNNEDKLLMEASSMIKRKTYAGLHADIKGTYSVNEMGCVVVTLQTESGGVIIPTNLFGAYNYQNVMAAIALGLHFGIELNNIKKALKNYFPQNNRSQLIKTANNRIILDAYNANPTSMQLVIKSFAELKDQKKMLILGDMLELGEKSKEEHQVIVQQLEDLEFKDVFLIGREFCATVNSFQSFQNVEEFSNFIKNFPPKDFSILMKGSRGIGIEKSLNSIS